jgi:2-oxoisovalerate dehydrogenase E1 component alpha subunit
VKRVQFLSSDGTLSAVDEFPLEITPQLCQALLGRMVLARRFDQEALALQRQGELGLWLQSWGQEAAQVGSMAALSETDWVFPSYRDHAAALCRGITPAEMLTQWRGCTASGWDPRKYRFHVYTLVLAAQLLHATGFAMGARFEDSDEVVMTYFGDGSSSEGDASESLNWAATFGLPVLFFCQNNQWAISTPVQQQSRSPLVERAAGFGMDSYLVDGNDVLAVLAVTKRAVSDIRAGGGPVLIEAQTYRMGGHSTSDDPSAYRPRSEVDAWTALDPLTRLRTYMISQGWATPEYLQALEADAQEFALETRRACQSLEAQPIEEIFDLVFAEENPQLARERDEYLAYAASFEDAEEVSR